MEDKKVDKLTYDKIKLYLKYGLFKMELNANRELIKDIAKNNNPLIPVYEDYFNRVISNYNISFDDLEDVMNIIKEFDYCIRYMKMDYNSLVSYYLKDILGELNEIQESCNVPGYDYHLEVGHVDINSVGGYKDGNGNLLDYNSLFDIASMTKMFTQVLATCLIQDGYFKYDSKIEDLDDRFTSLDGLTIGDIMRFMTKFVTDGRLDDVSNKGDSLNKLYNAKLNDYGTYNYNDIGMMILKEVFENVTGKDYETLLKEYIFEPIGLNDTFASVPISEIARVTGSPNYNEGMPNDSKAVIMGGVSGHAGIFASTSDLNKFGKSIMDGSLLGESNVDKMLVNNSTNPDRSEVYGNVFLHNKEKSNSWVRTGSPKDTISFQGSTRTSGVYSRLKDNDGSFLGVSSTIGLNPGSMNYEDAVSIQNNKNKEIELNNKINGTNKPLLNGVKEYSVDGKDYKLIDSRNYVGLGKIKHLNDLTVSLELRLLLLDSLLKYNAIKQPVISDRVSYKSR